MIVFTSIFFAISAYTLISLLFVIKEMINDGGIYGVNSGNLAGHLIILFFSMGCFYFSAKTTQRIKNGNSFGIIKHHGGSKDKPHCSTDGR